MMFLFGKRIFVDVFCSIDFAPTELDKNMWNMWQKRADSAKNDNEQLKHLHAKNLLPLFANLQTA